MRRIAQLTTTPKDLGNTAYNFLGRPAYTQDNWFKGKLSDFRVYDRALSASEIQGIAGQLIYQDIAAASAALNLGDLSSIKSRMILPDIGTNGTAITWKSSDESIVNSSTGNVTRPAQGAGNTTVTLTATIQKAAYKDKKTFLVTVQEQTNDVDSVALDKASLSLGSDLNALKHNLVLPASGTEVSTITWVSSNNAIINGATGDVNRPAKGAADATVTLTATIVKNSAKDTKVFTVTVAAQETYAGYLLSYFKSSDESLYQAYSRDGLHWTTLNKNQSVLKVTVGNKSVRDPDVIRGQDGVYHFLSTDSWTSPNLVIYDSMDLVHWERMDVLSLLLRIIARMLGRQRLTMIQHTIIMSSSGLLKYQVIQFLQNTEFIIERRRILLTSQLPNCLRIQDMIKLMRR